MSKRFELWRKTARWARGSKCKEASRCPHTLRNYTALESGTRSRRGACDSQRPFSRRPCGLVAGAMSMAAGEYVSVHSQAATEEAELKLERAELNADDKGEHKELMDLTRHGPYSGSLKHSARVQFRLRWHRLPASLSELSRYQLHAAQNHLPDSRAWTSHRPTIMLKSS
jgi:VIT family